MKSALHLPREIHNLLRPYRCCRYTARTWTLCAPLSLYFLPLQYPNNCQVPLLTPFEFIVLGYIPNQWSALYGIYLLIDEVIGLPCGLDQRAGTSSMGPSASTYFFLFLSRPSPVPVVSSATPTCGLSLPRILMGPLGPEKGGKCEYACHFTLSGVVVIFMKPALGFTY